MPAMDGSRDTRRSALRFRKMHGLGNDFVVIDQRERAWPLNADVVRAIGDRHRGVGFDQLAEIVPGTGGADADLVFWNADGSTAGACGNATRCVADLLLAERGTASVGLRTERGLLACSRRQDGLIEVDMGAPSLAWDEVPLSQDVDTRELPIDGAPSACSMGNPHCTFFVEDAEAVDLARLGPRIEHHPLFPERTNVQVVEVVSPTRARVRVWERGVGPTLASGSSSCAVVVNAVRRGLMERAATLTLDGGEIHIHWRESDGHVLMAGPVAYVFEGVFDPGFVSP
ncbi:MAG: diaminopimelate epimerase [Pseudomonadota bacterium]